MSKRRVISYSHEELEWVKANCTLVIGELHKSFCTTFNRSDVSKNNINALRKRNGWKTGRTGHFEKGHVGYKGGPKGPNKSSFKKGHVPANVNALYSERVCSQDGYILIKVPEANPYTGAKTRYKHKHIWLWEQENGSIPEGHVVIFKDGDKSRCELENLTCVSRGVLPIMNKYLKVQKQHEEIRESLILLAQVKHKIYNLANDNNDTH